MTEEEKEAIEKLEELSHYCALKNIDREDNKFGEFVVAIQKIKNLIQRQNIQIDLMAEHIEKGCDFDSRIQTKECIKQYFVKQAKEVEE